VSFYEFFLLGEISGNFSEGSGRTGEEEPEAALLLDFCFV